MDVLGPILAIGGIFLAIVIIMALASYVLMAAGLHIMGNNHDVEYAWVAWIPIGQFYVIGAILDEIELFGYEIKNLKWILLGAGVIPSFLPLSDMGFIGGLLGLAIAAFTVICLYKLLEMKGSSSPIGVLIASFFVYIVLPIVIFNLRNRPVN